MTKENGGKLLQRPRHAQVCRVIIIIIIVYDLYAMYLQLRT